MTTTAQNTKISTNSPARKSPEKCIVSADPWLKRQKNLQRRQKNPPKQKNKSTGKPGETSPFCAMNKYKMYIKNKKIQDIYKFFIFCPDILQKVDVNQMKPI